MPEVVQGEWSPSPGNRTFGQLKSEIARYVFQADDDEVLEMAGDGIVDAIRQLNEERWYSWGLYTEDITLTSGTVQEYQLPNTFMEPRSAIFLDTNGQPSSLRLSYVDPRTFQSCQAGSSNAIGWGSDSYTVMNARNNGILTLSMSLDATFVTNTPTLRVLYFGAIEYPTQDSQVLNIPAQVEHFVMWQAKAYVAASHAASKLPYAEAKAREALRRLIRFDRERGDWI